MKKSRRTTRRVPSTQRLWEMGQRAKRRPHRSKWFRRFPLALFLGILCIYLVFELSTLPFLSIANLNTENPKQTALMVQRIDEARAKGKTFNIDYRWIQLAKVSKYVRRAVLIAEDARFYDHAGLDWHEIEKSIETNWRKGRIVRGGSTITQQLAKNLYLSTSRDPIRKFKELLIAWMLEARLSKTRILELYLNIIEWGPGIFGIEAAAQRHFHKSASQLTREEAARLSAVIPSPLRHKPTKLTHFLEKKKAVILQRMSSR